MIKDIMTTNEKVALKAEYTWCNEVVNRIWKIKTFYT